MAQLLYRLGIGAARRPLIAIVGWLLALALGVTGFLAFGGTLSSTVSIPNTPTAQLTDRLQEEFPDAAKGSGQVVFATEDGSAFTSAQREQIEALLDRVEAEDVVDSTLSPFDAQARQQDAAAQLEDGRAQLEAGRAELEAGEAQAEQGAAQIESGRTQLEQARARLDSSEQELDAGQEQLDQARAQAEASGAPAAAVQAQLAPQQAQLDAGRAELEAGRAQLETQQRRLDAAEQELASGRQQAEAGRTQIADAEAELARGERSAALAQDFRLVSEDEAVAVGVVTFTGPALDVETGPKGAVVDLLTGADIEGVDVHPTQDLSATVPELLGPAEIVGLVVAAITLVVILGTFLAAGLPLLNALIGVGVGVTAALAFSSVTEMVSVTPVLGIMLGLAVGIDYALFIVNRHRQQLKTGMPVKESIGLANGTSGNAVVFAGLTVIIALAALNITGIPFLGLMGTVGAVCVLIAVLVATTLTPALLSLMGARALSRKERAALDRGERTVLHASPATERDGSYETLSTGRSVVLALVSAALLIVIALPFGSMRLGLPDGGSQPNGSDAKIAYDLTGEAFGEGYNGPLVVIADLPAGLSEGAATDAQLDVAEQVRGMDSVEAVVPAGLNEDGTVAMLQVIPAEGPNAVSTETLVTELRSTQPDGEAEQMSVAGMTSGFIDVSTVLSDALPLYLGVVVGLSLLIMVLVFRSLLVPLIATGGFVLSVFAAMGAVVAIYQWGWLGGLFGVTAPGPVLSFLPTIMIGVLFGLAMDYQLFIASGMREAYAHGTPARPAVLSGLRAGRAVVIAAAIIMISVFGGFIFAHDTMIRPIGFGLAMGVLLDAFVVRLLLIPALMHLLGPAAWWLPRWLDRILPDVDVEGASLERDHGAAPDQEADRSAAPDRPGTRDEQAGHAPGTPRP